MISLWGKKSPLDPVKETIVLIQIKRKITEAAPL